MPEIPLAAETGRPHGSRSAKRLRRAGQIPGVVYGHGTESVSVAVDARELRHALATEAGINALLRLRVDGTEHLTMVKTLQRHPVRRTVTHVDFVIVRRDELVKADVPVVLVGEADEVRRADGIVEQQLFSLSVHAVPSRIPNQLEVDVSGLAVGDTVRVGDLRLPDGVTTDLDSDEPVVVAQGPQALELPEAAEAAEEEAAEAVGEAAGGEEQADAAAEAGGAATEG